MLRFSRKIEVGLILGAVLGAAIVPLSLLWTSFLYRVWEPAALPNLADPLSGIDLLGIIVVAPILETGLQLMLLLGLRKVSHELSFSQQVLIVLFFFCALHAPFRPLWGLEVVLSGLVFCGILVHCFASQGAARAFVVTAVAHGAHNSVVALLDRLI